MIDLMTELNKYGVTERGNTSLVEAECGGGTAMYVELEEGKWLEVVMQPENYPAWFIAIQDKTKSEIRTHIEENYGNYYFQKNNIGANSYGRMPVDMEYVMERVRDHLYVYRDNKDFETKDTVTTIHDFLEKNEWSMDITDIEIIRQEFDN